MKNYAATCVFNEVMLVEGADQEEAIELALDKFENEYGLAPGQAYVDGIKEIK